ncbi:MAG: hypothetical protein PHV16_02370 [Candidatus Nanoarchaeia archaeon]|nr:hypothetical protein [Candidatus Nanoarchaeia archaeon]
MNKRGFELSINFIVILIISIVVFTFGLYILDRVMNKGDMLSQMLEYQFQEDMWEISCTLDKRVCVYPASIKIRPNKIGGFMLGIVNTLETQNFTIDVSETDMPRIAISNGVYWLCEDEKEIKRDKQERIPIVVGVPGGTPKGIYVLDVMVYTESGEKWGDTQKLQIVVPG